MLFLSKSNYPVNTIFYYKWYLVVISNVSHSTGISPVKQKPDCTSDRFCRNTSIKLLNPQDRKNALLFIQYKFYYI